MRELAAETVEHVHWLVKKNPGTRPEQLHHELMVDDPFMHRLVTDDRLVDIAAQFLGPNVAMFAAHYIAKKTQHRPSRAVASGRLVLAPRADGSYYVVGGRHRLDGWANGCMRVLPGTHTKRLLKRSEMVDLDRDKYVLGVGIHPDRIDDADAVDLELEAGGYFHPSPQHHPRVQRQHFGPMAGRAYSCATFRLALGSPWIAARALCAGAR